MPAPSSLKCNDDVIILLSRDRYSVFGLGSRAYPNFCAFAKSADKIIQELGGEQIFKMGEGDELCSQEESFKTWARNVFKVKCRINVAQGFLSSKLDLWTSCIYLLHRPRVKRSALEKM